MSDDGPVVLLTGGTSGIGREATRRLAADGATVTIVGRDADRGSRIAEESTAETDGTVRFRRADLAGQSTVRELAADVRASHDRLDVLAHNAGLSSSDRIETTDGIERTLAVNHLAPYLLTHELADRLRADGGARVVVTASGIHYRGTLDFADLQFERGYEGLDAYARSKLANVAFTVELADRFDRDGVVANCFTPGFVPSTGLFRESGLRTRLLIGLAGLVPGVGTTEAAGARRLETLATAPEWGSRTGAYVDDGGATEPDPAATDPDVRERLWRVSADLVGVDPGWP